MKREASLTLGLNPNIATTETMEDENEGGEGEESAEESDDSNVDEAGLRTTLNVQVSLAPPTLVQVSSLVPHAVV